MLVSEMITQIREQIHDITNEYSNSVLIKYINTGIKSASYLLASVNHNAVMKTMSVSTGTAVPANFIKLAGGYPIMLRDGKFSIYHPSTTNFTISYYEAKPSVTSTSDELPFKDELSLIYIEQYASILALNRYEFNVTTDEQLITSLKQDYLSAVTGGKGVTA